MNYNVIDVIYFSRRQIWPKTPARLCFIVNFVVKYIDRNFQKIDDFVTNKEADFKMHQYESLTKSLVVMFLVYSDSLGIKLSSAVPLT
jgi:hypothetical protein